MTTPEKHLMRTLAAATLVALATFAPAREWYIADDGTGQGASWDDAAALDDAATDMAAGDIMYVKGGNYLLTTLGLADPGIQVLDDQVWLGGFDPSATGTATDTVRNTSLYRPVFDAEGGSPIRGRHIILNGVSGVEFDGFRFINGYWDSTDHRAASVAWVNDANAGVAFRDCEWEDLLGVWGTLLVSNAYATADLSASFEKCVFKDVVASNWGSFTRIHCSGSSSDIELDFENCVFTDHSSVAGIIRIDNGGNHVINLRNCTFANNNSSGGGLMIYGTPTGEITNNIFADLDTLGVVLDLDNSSGFRIQNNLFDDSVDLTDGFALDYTNIRSGDPGFVNGATSPYDYRLAAGSDAIDRGRANGVTDDIEGTARPVSGLVEGGPARLDIGAYEAPAGRMQATWYVTPAGGGAGDSWDNATTLDDVVGNMAVGDTVFLSSGVYTLADYSIPADGISVLDTQAWIGGFDVDAPHDWAPESCETIFDAVGDPIRRHVYIGGKQGVYFAGISFDNGHWNTSSGRSASIACDRNAVNEFEFSRCSWRNAISTYGSVLAGDTNAAGEYNGRFTQCLFSDSSSILGTIARLHFNTGKADLTFESCVFSGLETNVGGGNNSLISLNLGGPHTLNLRNCTFAHNTCQRLLYSEASVTGDIVNNIFANIADVVSSALAVLGGGVPTVQYNLFDETDYLSTPFTLDDTNYTGRTPMFVSGSTPPYDYRLRRGAFSIDRGTDSGVTADADGTSRPLDGLNGLTEPADLLGDFAGAQYDLGAYESAAGSKAFFVAPGGAGSGLSWDDPISLENAALESQAPVGTVYAFEEGVHTTAETLTGASDQVFAGGYDSATHAWDPEANTTVLDAGGQTRLLLLPGSKNVEIVGLTFANGSGRNAGSETSRSGAILLSDSASVNVERCRFTGNTGQYGAVASVVHTAAGDCSMMFDRCLFDANVSEQRGAIVRLSTSTGTDRPSAVFHNCVMVNNTNEGSATGLIQPDYGQAEVSLVNCTVADNSSYSVVRIDNLGAGAATSGTIVNTIFADNTLDPAGFVLDVVPDSVSRVSTSHNLFKASSQLASNGSLIDANSLTGAEPGFIDQAGGDYSVGGGSDALDVGTAAGAPDHDFDNNPRPRFIVGGGSGYDIGAYEIPGPTPYPGSAVPQWTRY